MGRRTDIARHGSARSRRMYEEGGNWYFNTREGTVIGPFADELEAYTQLEVYIRLADSGMLREGEDPAAQAAGAESAG
jgi:hypothetical protein